MDLPFLLLILIGLFVGTFLTGQVFQQHKSNRLRKICSCNTWIVGQVNHLNVRFYLLLFTGSCTAGLYVFAPDEYARLALPIDPLDDPLINSTGVVILELSLMWGVGVQLALTKTLNWDLKMSRQAPSQHKQWLYDTWFLHANMLSSASIVVLLIGLFVTISSIAALILACAGLILFKILLLSTERI